MNLQKNTVLIAVLAVAVVACVFLLASAARSSHIVLGPPDTEGSAMSDQGVGAGHTFGTCFVWGLNDFLVFQPDLSGFAGFSSVGCNDVADSAEILATVEFDFSPVINTQPILFNNTVLFPLIPMLPGATRSTGFGLSDGLIATGTDFDGRGWWSFEGSTLPLGANQVYPLAVRTNISTNGVWLSAEYDNGGGGNLAIREDRATGSFSTMNGPRHAAFDVLNDGTLVGWVRIPDPLNPVGNIEAPAYWPGTSLDSTIMALLDEPGCAAAGADYVVKTATQDRQSFTGQGCDGAYNVVWLAGGITAVTFEDFIAAGGVVLPPGLTVEEVAAHNDDFTRFMTTVRIGETPYAAVITVPEPAFGVALALGMLTLLLLVSPRRS